MQAPCEPDGSAWSSATRPGSREENREETLDFLRSLRAPYVCVDMPQGHTSSVPPVVAATADLAVMRFHGHSDKWESKDIYDRFGYRYSAASCRVGPRLRSLADQARRPRPDEQLLHDYAQTNAQQLVDLLSEGRLDRR